MAKIKLRAATEADLENLIQMRIALQKHLESRDPDMWKFSQRGFEIAPLEVKARLRSKSSFMGIAETEDGRAVGMVMAEAARDEYRDPEFFGHIHWVYVAEDARRHGLGRALVNLSCDFLSSHDIKQVTMGYVINNPEAHAFWNKLGFIPRVAHSSTTLDSLRNILSAPR